jgi:hypothetical protein
VLLRFSLVTRRVELTVGAAHSPCRRIVKVIIMGFIPTSKAILKRWAAELSANISAFGPGIGLLTAQIEDLERRCVAMHHRIEDKLIRDRMHKGKRSHSTARAGARSAKPYVRSR